MPFGTDALVGLGGRTVDCKSFNMPDCHDLTLNDILCAYANNKCANKHVHVCSLINILLWCCLDPMRAGRGVPKEQ